MKNNVHSEEAAWWHSTEGSRPLAKVAGEIRESESLKNSANIGRVWEEGNGERF